MPFLPPIAALPEESFRIVHVPAWGRRRGYVVLLPELWGIVPQIEATARRFAAEGFEVYVPDLLPGTIEPSGDPEQIKARYAAADDVLAMKKVAYIVERIREDAAQDGPVIVIGYCYGGRMALHAAAHVKVEGVVSFYGTYKMPSGKRALDPWQSARDATVPLQAHYGADDSTIPPADIEAARLLLQRGRIFVYPGAGHAFMNETRDSFRPAQAAEAWGRVLDFLRDREQDWALSRPPIREPWEESAI